MSETIKKLKSETPQHNLKPTEHDPELLKKLGYSGKPVTLTRATPEWLGRVREALESSATILRAEYRTPDKQWYSVVLLQISEALSIIQSEGGK